MNPETPECFVNAAEAAQFLALTPSPRIKLFCRLPG